MLTTFFNQLHSSRFHLDILELSIHCQTVLFTTAYIWRVRGHLIRCVDSISRAHGNIIFVPLNWCGKGWLDAVQRATQSMPCKRNGTCRGIPFYPTKCMRTKSSILESLYIYKYAFDMGGCCWTQGWYISKLPWISYNASPVLQHLYTCLILQTIVSHFVRAKQEHCCVRCLAQLCLNTMHNPDKGAMMPSMTSMTMTRARTVVSKWVMELPRLTTVPAVLVLSLAPRKVVVEKSAHIVMRKCMCLLDKPIIFTGPGAIKCRLKRSRGTPEFGLSRFQSLVSLCLSH